MVHVQHADRALAGVVAGNSRDLKVLRVQGSAALEEAQSLARHARGARGRVHAVRALSSVERQFGRDAGQLSGVLALEPSSAQSGIAGTIAGSTLGEQIAASVLAHLLPLLPTAAQGPLRGVLAQLPGQEASQAAQLAGSLDAGSIVCTASGAVEQALTLATQAIGIGLSQAQSALAMVPGGAGSQFQGILSGLPAQLAGIEKLVQGILPCASSNPTTPGSSTGSSILPVNPVSLISGITKLINEILSEVLPAWPGTVRWFGPDPGKPQRSRGRLWCHPGLSAGMPGFSGGIPFLSGGIPGFSGGIPFLSGGLPF